MSEIYLMVNGKKIELPEKTIELIKDSFVEKTKRQKLIDEFCSHLSSYKGSIKEEISYECISKTSGRLKVPYPISNIDWTYEVWDACKKFCGSSKDRYPRHDPKDDPLFLYIYVENK